MGVKRRSGGFLVLCAPLAATPLGIRVKLTAGRVTSRVSVIKKIGHSEPTQLKCMGCGICVSSALAWESSDFHVPFIVAYVFAVHASTKDALRQCERRDRKYEDGHGIAEDTAPYPLALSGRNPSP